MLSALGLAALVAAGDVRAQWDDDRSSDWQIATTVAADPQIGYWRCEYETLGNGEQFIVNMRSGCPASVQFNPLTGQVRD